MVLFYSNLTALSNNSVSCCGSASDFYSPPLGVIDGADKQTSALVIVTSSATLGKTLAQFSTHSRNGRDACVRKTTCIHPPPSQPTNDAALLAPGSPSARPPSAAPPIQSPAAARMLPPDGCCGNQHSPRVSVDGRGCQRQFLRWAIDHAGNSDLHADTHRHRQTLARSHCPAAIGYFQGLA
jgi:hypothetical protein